MREMRLKKREITDPEILREILESCEVVRIGAMDEEGMFIVPKKTSLFCGIERLRMIIF